MLRFDQWTVRSRVQLLALPAAGLVSVLVPTLIGTSTPAEMSCARGAETSTLVPFVHSSTCSRCHSNSPAATAMRDSQSNDVSPFDLWQSSMMANSARDPYWRAAVSAEVAATDGRESEILGKCMRCHTPMAHPDGVSEEEYEMSFSIFDELNQRGELARDGVSCTVCHMITPDRLGEDASYTGGFTINDSSEIYGPHQNLLGGPMLSFTGLDAVTGPHINESALCATCHTLSTDALRTDGTATGTEFFEQTPYLEWRNSNFQDEVMPAGSEAASCQGCHMPRTDSTGAAISTRVARAPNGRDYGFLPPRDPYGQHTFVGGNTLMPQIFRDNAVALGVTAPAAAFDATAASARDQLQNRTARVEIASASRSGARINVAIDLFNDCGHKFPSGYPARRAFLRLRVYDAGNNVVFESGGFDTDGRLLDGTNGQVLASELASGPTLPHRDSITSAAQAQVYGAIVNGPGGAVTWRLLQMEAYRRDNRLLPRGWSSSHPEAARTQPHGLNGDSNFVAGSDRVHYAIDVPVSGALRVEAELFYQSIAPRHVAEIAVYNTPEIQDFLGYYQAANKTPVRVDGDSTSL